MCDLLSLVAKLSAQGPGFTGMERRGLTRGSTVFNRIGMKLPQGPKGNTETVTSNLGS